MNSEQMLKTELPTDYYFHNRAKLGQVCNWVILPKIHGYMVTQKQYDEAVRKENARVAK